MYLIYFFRCTMSCCKLYSLFWTCSGQNMTTWVYRHFWFASKCSLSALMHSLFVIRLWTNFKKLFLNFLIGYDFFYRYFFIGYSFKEFVKIYDTLHFMITSKRFTINKAKKINNGKIFFPMSSAIFLFSWLIFLFEFIKDTKPLFWVTIWIIRITNSF